MNRFYMSMDCGKCGGTIFMGPCRSYLEHNGLPEIPFDFAAQQTFTCDCGTTYATGDFGVMDEGEL